ncbi:hypothetical protein ACKE8C_18375, partial [Yersinia enterocolitica]
RRIPFVKISVPDGSCRAVPGADALLFCLSSPYNIASSRFVSSLTGQFTGPFFFSADYLLMS